MGNVDSYKEKNIEGKARNDLIRKLEYKIC
jgi:hypothetical protein